MSSGVCATCPAPVTDADKAATDKASQGYKDPRCPPCLLKYMTTPCAHCSRTPSQTEDSDICDCSTCGAPFCCNCDPGDDQCLACFCGRCDKCNCVLEENWELYENDEPVVKTCETCWKAGSDYFAKRTCKGEGCAKHGSSDDGFMINKEGEWWCNDCYDGLRDKFKGAKQPEKPSRRGI